MPDSVSGRAYTAGWRPVSGCGGIRPPGRSARLSFMSMTEAGGPNRRRWLGAAIALFVPLVILRGLNRSAQLRDGPLSAWYVQAGVVVAGVLVWLAVEWLIGRAYRHKE